jgi:hypothetical protein
MMLLPLVSSSRLGNNCAKGAGMRLVVFALSVLVIGSIIFAIAALLL